MPPPTRLRAPPGQVGTAYDTGVLQNVQYVLPTRWLCSPTRSVSQTTSAVRAQGGRYRPSGAPQAADCRNIDIAAGGRFGLRGGHRPNNKSPHCLAPA